MVFWRGMEYEGLANYRTKHNVTQRRRLNPMAKGGSPPRFDAEQATVAVHHFGGASQCFKKF